MADSKTIEIILSAKDEVSKVINDIGNNFKKTSSTITESLNKALVPSAAFATALAFGGNSILKASQELENSLLGLARVSTAFSQSQDDAKKAALSLASDGLMSVSDAAAGLKNLIATGFELPQAIKLMNAFKDSAAFNRQGTLAFGDAIVGATVGLKNQNSILIDNVGITKNLSVMIKEAGLKQEDFMRITDDASVRQTIMNQILKEAAVFSGDAAVMTTTYSGKVAELDTRIYMLSAQLGDKLKPIMYEVLNAFVDVIGKVGEAVGWFEKHQLATIVLAGAIAGALVPAMWGFVTAVVAAGVALAPFIAAGGALAALIAGLNWFVQTKTGYSIIDQLIAGVKLLGETFGGVLKQMKEFSDAVDAWFKKNERFDIGKQLQSAGEMLKRGIPAFADGGFVGSTGLAMVHAGEFVLSRDMLSGQQSIPNNVTYNNGSAVTVNASINSEVDINQVANRIAWALKNSR